MNRIILIDGNSLLFRAFFALPPMTSRDGIPTGAVHGFLSMLLKLLSCGPDYCAVAFDLKTPTFRHLRFDAYKAGRRETPDELITQIDLVKDLLAEMGIRVITLEGYEADDILGTLSLLAEKEGIPSLIVTGDRDALQLVSDLNHVLLTKKGISETVEYTPGLLLETFGLTPEQMKDLKALMGDNSDNIPGVPGVGEKTALKLLAEYGDLKSILENAQNIKGKLGERIRENTELAMLSYELGTIDREAPVPEGIRDCAFDPGSMLRAKGTLMKLGLNGILQRLPELSSRQTAEPEKTLKRSTRTLPELEDLIRNAKERGSIAIDYESGFTLAYDPENCFVVSDEAGVFPEDLQPGMIWSALKEILCDRTVEKIVFDSKKLRHILRGYGCTLDGPVQDLMIEEYLINAVRPAADARSLVRDRLQTDSCNAAILYDLSACMRKELLSLDMGALYDEMEYPLSEVLFEMECAGFTVDGAILNELSADFGTQAAELEKEIYALAGEKFNILSTKQLGHILFEKLSLPTGKKTKTGFSTDADTLESIREQHPIVEKVIDYRFVTKLKSTFLDGLLQSIDGDGKLHTQFNQCVTATGRISSTEPNLQNIPVRTAQGREIRKAFIAEKGNVLVGADYSQIELRLLAHISGDESLIAAFNSGDDIHRRTASEIFGIPLEAVTPDLRSAAKAVNFGIVYGISDFGLARNLNIPIRRAGQFIEQYLNRYSKVREYMRSSVEQGRRNGYAVTLFHRRRNLPELKSGNYNTRSFGERVAMNMPIQGTAADIIKMAMVNVFRALRDGGYKARLVLQIHDELIIDTPVEERDAVLVLIREIMENVIPLKVPLLAEAKAGMSWFDTK